MVGPWGCFSPPLFLPSHLQFCQTRDFFSLPSPLPSTLSFLHTKHSPSGTFQEAAQSLKPFIIVDFASCPSNSLRCSNISIILSCQVNKRCRFLLDFEKVVKRVPENSKPDDHPFGGQDLDASSLGWAMSAVSSRAFRLYGNKLPDGTRVDVPMMLPLIDMCNHSFNPNAEIVQENETGTAKMLVKVVAGTKIKRDDPLVLNYGGLNNDFFLLDYGFVIPSNPYDCIELKYDAALFDAASMAAGVESPNFSSPAPWQQDILSQLNLHGEDPVLKVSLGGPELVEGRLLAALRVLLANDMERVQKHDLNTLKSLSVKAPLGIPNEVLALRTIISLCVIALGHFPTKIMEDESLLKQGISDSTELAIQFRIQKKSLIIDVMRDLTRRVKFLSSEESTTA